MSGKYISISPPGQLSGAVTVNLDDSRFITVAAIADGKWEVTITYIDKSKHQVVLPGYDAAMDVYTAILKELGIAFSL